MLAVVELNGKQYQLEEGRYLKVDKLPQAAEESLEFGNVLLIVDGKTTLVGAPYIPSATVKAKVLSHGRDRKVIVYKMRSKKGYRRKNGHRQDFSMLQVDLIQFPGRTSEPIKFEPTVSKRPIKIVETKAQTKAQAASVKAAPAKKPVAPKATAAPATEAPTVETPAVEKPAKAAAPKTAAAKPKSAEDAAPKAPKAKVASTEGKPAAAKKPAAKKPTKSDDKASE